MQPFAAESATTPRQQAAAVFRRPISSPAGVNALRSALQAELQHRAEPGATRRAIRVLCHEAHRRGLHVEDVLVAFKEAWRSIPEAYALTPAGSRDEVLEYLVGLCIDEFYATLD